MSVPATRMGDICTGHGCFPPRPSCSGSPDVIINSLPAKRMGDCFLPHACPGSPPHMGLQVAGCPRTLADSLPMSAIGHPVSCGSFNLTGSPDTFICFV
jgi:uncharacterized Zn-binding protein involved in type VI secretion